MCKLYRFTGLTAPLFALGVLLLSVPAVQAHEFSIELDKKFVLQAITQRKDKSEGDALWRELNDLSLKETNHFKVQPEPDNELRAVLKGDIVVCSLEAGQAVVRQLKLVRESESAPWKIDPADVERTLKSRHKMFNLVVTVDGQRVGHTYSYFRKGKQKDNPTNVWREVKRSPLHFVLEHGTPQPGEGTETVVPLEGNVVVELNYNGQTWDRVEISKLKIRRPGPVTLWGIDRAEADQIFDNVPALTN